MSKPYPKYDEEFKKNLVELHKNGKSQIQLHNEYGVSHSALSKWIKQYSEVKMDDNTIITAKEIRQLLKEKAALEEENLILKKAAAIFMLDCTVKSRHKITPQFKTICSFSLGERLSL